MRRPECPVAGCVATRIYPVDMAEHLRLQHPLEDEARHDALMDEWMGRMPIRRMRAPRGQA